MPWFDDRVGNQIALVERPPGHGGRRVWVALPPGARALIGGADANGKLDGLARYGAFPGTFHVLAWLLRRAVSVEGRDG